MRPGLKIVGIDPGTKGSVALLDINSGAASFFDMPVIRYKSRTGRNRTSVDEDGLIKLLRDISGPHIVCTVAERQQPFPKGRKSTAFSMGYGYGVIVATIKSLPVLASSFESVKPQVWKRDLGLVKEAEMKPAAFKELSRQLALRLFPGAADSLKRIKDENRAEALLIAEWARKHVLRKYISGYRYRSFPQKCKVIATLGGEAIHRASTI